MTCNECGILARSQGGDLDRTCGVCNVTRKKETDLEWIVRINKSIDKLNKEMSESEIRTKKTYELLKQIEKDIENMK